MSMLESVSEPLVCLGQVFRYSVTPWTDSTRARWRTTTGIRLQRKLSCRDAACAHCNSIIDYLNEFNDYSVSLEIEHGNMCKLVWVLENTNHYESEPDEYTLNLVRHKN